MGEAGRRFRRAGRQKWATLQDKIDAVDGWTLDNQLEIAMEALRCPPSATGRVDNLSGGEKRRVALTRLLIQKPSSCCWTSRPTTSTPKASQWLENHLKEYAGAVLMITHDRYFLDNVVGLDPRTRSRHATTPTKATTRPTSRRRPSASSRKSREESGRQKALSASWNGSGRPPPRARPSRKARIRKFEELQDAQDNRKPGKAQIVIQVPERLGGKVIEAKNITKAYGDKLLFEDLSFMLPPGGIVGVIGPNGAGKSTLFKIITGQEEPDSGTIEIGETVHLGYVDQSRDHLERQATTSGRKSPTGSIT